MMGSKYPDRGWRSALLCAAVSLVLSVLLSGCQGRRQGPSPPPSPRGGRFPVTMKDAQGVRVHVERRPERIVSLAPTVTEILYAIGVGGRVAAAADPADYPPEASKLPRVGGWFTPSAEKTLAAEPDLVIGSRGNPPEFLASLRKAGCAVFTIDPKTLDDISSAIRSIGAITGADAGAARVVEAMKRRLASVASKVEGVPQEKRPTAFMIVGLNPIWTAGSGTFQDEAIRAAGGRNIAAELEGFRPFSTESLLAADPEFVLLPVTPGDRDGMKRTALSDPVLKRLSAVREGRLVLLEANPIMRPGPRIAEAIEAMARVFYPSHLGGSPARAVPGSPGRDR